MVKVGTITASYMWESVNPIEHEPKHDPSPEMAEARDFILKVVG